MFKKRKKMTVYTTVAECAFLPAIIYRTESFTSTVIQNAYMNGYYSIPHMAVICSLVNNNHLDYEVIDPIVVLQNWRRVRHPYLRGLSAKEIHYQQKRTNILVSIVNVYKMIQDKKFRYKCCDCICLNEEAFMCCCYQVWLQNRTSLTNLLEFFRGISFTQKMIFLISPLIAPWYYRLKYYLRCLYIFSKTDLLK